MTAACLNFLLGGVMDAALSFVRFLTLVSTGILDVYKAKQAIDGR